MVKYIVKRLLLSVFILFGVSLIIYCMVRMLPANIIYEKLQSMSVAGVDAAVLEQQLKEQYGLDSSILVGYWNWLKAFVQGDFGTSWSVEGQPVADVIFRNMGISFAISFVSLILQLLIAIPLGIKCACNQYGKLDYFATFLTMIGISFPTFFLGNILKKVFALDLGWFPSGGIELVSDGNAGGFMSAVLLVKSMVLPMFLLTVLSVGSWVRYTRTNTLEVLNAYYIRTARAKGLSEHSVVYKHVFRNTLIPLVTVLAGTLPSLFGGAMITEQVFDLPGIGNTAYKALMQNDIPFIMTYNMFIAVLTVVGILLTDIMYAVVDPRVKLGK